MSKLRIVYMGTPDFAVFPLRTLMEEGFEVVGVVTNPDKPVGRGQKIRESPVKIFAREAGLPVLQPFSFKDEGFLESLGYWNADLQVVVAFKMLPESVWNMPCLGTINLHASLLPDYRGAAPINRAIMNGECETGVTTFLLSANMDEGNILYSEKVAIAEDMIAGELHDILMEKGARLLVKTLRSMEKGEVAPISQKSLLGGRLPTPAPKIFKEDMHVDWTKPGRDVYNLIRGLSPYPAAWTEFVTGGKSLHVKIFSAEFLPWDHNGDCGNMESDGKTYLRVNVPDGKISIKELQVAGKRRMAVEEFLRGFDISKIIIV